MKRVTKIQTFDGELHDSESKALHYLEVAYSNMMSNVAARLSQYSDGKHVRTMEWIDENLKSFADLSKIKNDMQMIENDCD